MLALFLVTLFLAPQVWLGPFVGWRVDLVVYPLWLILTIKRGRWMPGGLQHADLVFLLFFVWLVVTTVFHGFHEAGPRGQPSSLGHIINYTKYFLLYQFVIGYAKHPRNVDHIGRWLLFFAGILVVESIQHKLGGTHLGWAGQTLAWADPDVIAAGGTGRTRWVHIFDGPGVFCVVFTIALPFALRFLYPWQPHLKRLLGAALSIALLIAVYFNGSRGGFLTTLFILSAFTVLRYRASLFAYVVGVGLAVVLVMAAPSSLTTIRDQSHSTDHRIDMWAEGIEMATQNPILGIGRGNFGVYTGDLVAHNSAIEIMGEMGFVGLFFWVALIYLCAKGVWQAYVSANDRAMKSLAVAVGISLAGYVVSSMFVTLEYETFYLLLGLSAATGMATGRRLMLRSKDVRNVLAIIAVWFVLLKTYVVMYY